MTGEEDVQSLRVRQDCGARCRVETQRALGPVEGQGTRAKADIPVRDQTAGQCRRPNRKCAGGSCQGCGATADRARTVDHRQIGPGPAGVAEVRRQAGRIVRLIGEQGRQVVGGGKVLVLGPQRGPVGIVDEGRDVAAVKIAAGKEAKVQLAEMGPLGPAILAGHPQAIEFFAQHGVDHPGHGIGTIDGRSAVHQYLDPPQARDRDGVGVVAQNRHRAGIGRALAGGVLHDPATVQQHQRIADSK